MWKICLKCWNMTEDNTLGLEDNLSQYYFKICFYIYRYSIQWDKTEAKSLEFWRITFLSVLLSPYSWSVLLHHCFLYIGPYEIQVCVQLLKTHEQLLSSHCKQVCFLSDTSTTFPRGQAHLLYGKPIVGHPRLWEFNRELLPA